jgi:transcriptional regulator with XRE-family HTH domain
MESNYNLLVCRKKAKLSQKELADKLGITRSLISMFEQGVASPTYNTAVDLARILQVKPKSFTLIFSGQPKEELWIRL